MPERVTMKHETTIQTVQGSIAVGGGVASFITLNEMVALATLVYIVSQTIYLYWKWNKERKAGK